MLAKPCMESFVNDTGEGPQNDKMPELREQLAAEQFETKFFVGIGWGQKDKQRIHNKKAAVP